MFYNSTCIVSIRACQSIRYIYVSLMKFPQQKSFNGGGKDDFFNEISDRMDNRKADIVSSWVGKGDWGVTTECARNEMFEGRRETHTACQRDATVKVPELAE